ncbi:MAG: GntP family permease [Bacteroidales bacterium]|nr:GntP family permease [Bacteroidales bacterium]
MNSAIAAIIGLALAIILIIRKIPPVFALFLGALAGGLLAGWGMVRTVNEMISGVKDIVPAIVRILAAGVLSGMLVVTGAAESISASIVRRLGVQRVYLALTLASMLLCATGVFIDVAVITIAPIALMIGRRVGAPLPRLMIAMIGGGKCGNIISPNPNTIIAAENFGAPLQSVMLANLLPALIGLIITVWLVIPLVPKGKIVLQAVVADNAPDDSHSSPGAPLPSFLGSIAGPLLAVVLLALRPLFGIAIDPMVALPAGGLLGLVTTRRWKLTLPSLKYGLEKMSGVAVLLVGTGAIAGIIKASAITTFIVNALGGWSGGGELLAPIAGILMCAATASTTAGATIASSSFSDAILAAGVNPVAGAAMVNAGATVLDHLPHGSFFNATGGCVGMSVAERIKIIPYESLVGITLTLLSFLAQHFF